MDPQTSGQVIAALIALGGALLGAVVAATIQWWNTHATIEAAKVTSREQAERVRDHEHAAWLRNHKAEVYAKFIDATLELTAKCHSMERGPERQEKIPELVFAARPTLLTLVAPDDIRALADDIYGNCLWLTLALFPREGGPHTDRWLEKIKDELDRLGDLFRADLRAPSAVTPTEGAL